MKQRHHFRRAALVAGLSVAAMALANGAMGQEVSPAGRTEITFSYLWGGAEAKALEGVIADYNKSQDKVFVKGVSSPDSTKQLASMSSANGAFDISDNFGANVGAWASKGILAPLDGYKLDTTDFVAAAMDQMRYDGKLYALPIALHDYQLIYNKDALEEAGLTPPKTMDAFAADIKKLTETDKDGNVTRLGLGYANLSTTLTVLGYAFGGDYTKGGKPTPAEPGNLEGIRFYKSNVIDPSGAEKVNRFIAGFGPYMSAQDAFLTGKMAMVIDGEWRAAFLKANKPDFDWGVAPIPASSDALADATLVEVSTLFIPTNSRHKAEAADFLKFVTSPAEMLKFSHALGNLPARKSLLEASDYSDLPHFDAWLKALGSPNAKSVAAAPFTAEYNSDLASAFDSVAQGSQSPENAMKGVADRSSSYAQ